MPNKQDRKTQRLFNNVTKSLLAQAEAQENATSSYPLNDLPLKEEYPVAKAYIAATAPFKAIGTGIAKGLGWVGEKMMPSALLKGIGQTFPKLAKATTALSPYADAGLLATWGAQGIQEAKEAAKSGDAAGAIAGASMAALPLMGINPEAALELTATQKANKIARALNKGVKSAEIVDSPVTQNILAGKFGWAPRQNKVIWHNSETPISKLESTFPAWDIVKRDAPLGHVWGTGTETRQGFIGARPFHLRSTKPVEMNKPMVQLNESIGNGKNAVRNEILKYADQSGADAVNFSNIKDNTLSNQDVYAVFKDVNVKPKLSEAERLGIPKSLRSDSRALEDPYYWGYEQWNQRYNDAVKTGNIKEVQRLRDLHFQTKAINNQLQVDGHPITLYHGNLASDSQLASAGYNPYSTARTAVGSSGYFAVTDPQIASTYKGPSGSIKTVYGYSKNPAVYDAKGRNGQNAFIKEVDGHKFGVKTDAVVNSAFNSGHDAVLIDNVVDYGFNTPASHPRQPFTDYVFKPGHVKLRDAVVEDGLFFEPIPIVKRDNFHNPDIRYKQGGILKAQKGKSLIKLINKTTKRPITFINDFSGVENIAKETVGFGGVRPNTGLTSLETENRSKQLIQSFEEMMKTRTYNSKRDAFLKNRIGKVWNELTPSEQYQAEVRFKEYWNK